MNSRLQTLLKSLSQPHRSSTDDHPGRDRDQQQGRIGLGGCKSNIRPDNRSGTGSVTPRAIDAGGGTRSAFVELPLNGGQLRCIA